MANTIEVQMLKKTIEVQMLKKTIEVQISKPAIQIYFANKQGVSGPPGLPYTRWIDYVAGYDSLLYLETIAEGDVYQYDYLPNTTLYRCIDVEDIFYSSFAGGVLSGEVIRKKITL